MWKKVSTAFPKLSEHKDFAVLKYNTIIMLFFMKETSVFVKPNKPATFCD